MSRYPCRWMRKIADKDAFLNEEKRSETWSQPQPRISRYFLLPTQMTVPTQMKVYIPIIPGMKKDLLFL
jgi:hypothetical protein